MAKTVKDRAGVRNKQAFDHAEVLYMNGVLQKDICERVGVSAVTLGSWIGSFGWKEKRAAKTITRQELVNRLLVRVDELTSEITEGETEEGKKGGKATEDKLAKLAKLIAQLDKEASVVDFIECFIQFSTWLNNRQEADKTITAELSKTVNRLQDAFINDKLSMKR